MDIFNTISLKGNDQIKINFYAGNLLSDAGLLIFKEFLFKIGTIKLINHLFKTNDTASFRIHRDNVNLMQLIYQIISELRKVIYSIKKPKFMLFDIDSTLLNTYRKQGEKVFIITTKYIGIIPKDIFKNEKTHRQIIHS